MVRGSLWKVITSSTSSMPAPAASSTALALAKAFRVCAATSPASVTRPSSVTLPWPERNKRSPTRTAAEAGRPLIQTSLAGVR